MNYTKSRRPIYRRRPSSEKLHEGGAEGVEAGGPGHGGGDEARPHGQGKRLLGHDQGPFYLLFFSYILWHGECVKKKKKGLER